MLLVGQQEGHPPSSL